LIEQDPDSVAPRMHSAQPLDILFEEAGASLGRIERELRLKDEARAARFEARLAAIELAAFKAEEDRQRKFEARMAGLRDGKDGEPGKDGKDADIEPIKYDLEAQMIQIRRDYSDLINETKRRLAEVRDGKDGEPGKDADIELLKHEIADFFDKMREDVSTDIEAYKDSVEAEVLQRLAEVKDGKDGEAGKDADIQPLWDAFNQREINIGSAFVDLEEKIDERLAQVKDGKDGEPGPPGKDGQDGKLPIAREWTNRVHYAGDVVRHNGSTYQALADTGREPPHGDWGELASRGTDGRGFALRGTYDASAEYRQHDVVMINRNSFAAKYDNPGECPGDGWTLFAASGQRGKEGPPGQPGLKGADGRIISITKWEADPDEMVLRIADSTGNTFTVDLQPIAERILEAAR
jgi:hypothetical protein